MARPLLGMALQPHRQFLQLCRALIEERAEIFEISPETLWDERCEPGPGYEFMLQLRQRSGRPFVSHGVLYSIGAVEAPPSSPKYATVDSRGGDGDEDSPIILLEADDPIPSQVESELFSLQNVVSSITSQW